MSTSAKRFGEDFGGERMWGLRELAYPDAIPLVPQTPGWIAVGVLLVLALFWLGWLVYRRRQKNAYRRQATKHLAAIASSTASPAELPFILRRAALRAFPRKDVASLHGDAWRIWLNDSAGRELYRPEDMALIDNLAYLPVQRLEQLQDSSELQHLITQTRLWLRHHHA